MAGAITHHDPARSSNGWWLFSAPLDLVAFLGSAVIALSLLWVGHMAGVLHAETPDWAWIPCILLIDVAHVYATGFRVYWDRDEFRRRPLLYIAVPVCGFVIGVAIYSEYGEMYFWRVLAYLAVPQLTHYLLDGFIWRRKNNPNFNLIGPQRDPAQSETSCV